VKANSYFARLPWMVPCCAAALVAAGLTGILRGDELTGAGRFFPRQVVWVVLAAPVMIGATLLPYRRLRELSYPVFGTCLVGLVAVYICPPRNYAQRWIPLGFADLQPSEPAKLAYILALAHYLMHRRNYRRLTGLVVPFLMTAVPMVLILKEPDLGTSLLFFPVLFAMLFAAGARLRHLAAVTVLGVAFLPALWSIMSGEQRSRITALFTQQDGGPAPEGDGYHQHQSKQVLALGGLWGSRVAGMPLSDPLAYHLPACRTDFIYCLVGERWGLAGAAAVLCLYLVLFARGLAIAAATHEPYGRLIAVGIVTLLAAQLIINAGMTVGLMPVTGLTLPLMSYGGSSLLTTGLALGLLMNVGLRPGYEVTGEPFRFGGRCPAGYDG
jgi:cell division protein FtsW (lipid II flippase)